MKHRTIWGAMLLTLSAMGAVAQDIPQSQVPALVVNSLQQQFPKAKNIDWELKNGLYEAEFETGLFGSDHELWIQHNGKIVRHKEDLSKNDLPKAVLAKVRKDFRGYRLEDVKRITEGRKVCYAFEVKSSRDEWKLMMDPNGNVLEKRRD
ncbi:PepSY-like domain-containing protein [Sphingobacterium thalpophilum]|uniref:PepSY-like domain-containing protein n=1 Tax=Sphingobacterium thalpophilum TaxID=259 RepID=A0A4U9UPV9_9SPHI|nr:PepSY-like domain-containing protein [Sphingobacterium thalpophilum]VTR34002.1 Protein of uncharacterised function (DUF2874) [Sphingobacterium thalpophilum]